MLREIQAAAISRDSSITDLLRRCKILAVRLGSAEFAEWVDLELGGYPTDTELPPYRVRDAPSKGHFVGSFGRQLKNAPIPLGSIPEPLRDNVRLARMREPIGSYEDLLLDDGGGGVFESPWPADLVAYVGTEIFQAMSCIAAWQEISRGFVVSILDAVRNRILNFSLELETLAPDAGQGTGEEQPISSEKVSQVFHTHVYGNVGNIASGSQAFSQSAVVVPGDFIELSRKLEEIGFNKQEVEGLRDALEQDGDESAGMGKHASGWLGRAITKAGEGALKITTETAIRLLPRLLGSYLGLPPSP